jgi:cyclic-di-GMP-binding protein
VASENSFDIVSKIDLQEVDNALQQALKEIQQRYDFKGSISDIRREKEILHLVADDEYKLKAVSEILLVKLAARRVPAKGLTFKTPEQATGQSLRQQIVLQQGIPQEQAKEIVKILKSSGLKVQASIQADQVRVKGKSKDELQGAMKILRDSSLKLDMQFTNFR